MTLDLNGKKSIVAEVSKEAKNAVSALAADYRGLSVSELNDLRAKARESGVYMRVVRNTLAKRALEGTDFSCLHEVLSGPIILAFSKVEPGAAARLAKDFLKTNEKLIVKALALSGKLFSAKDLDSIAKLPSYDEAIAILMSTMKAPIVKFVRTLVAPHTKLVRTLAAVRDEKQAAA